MFPVQFHHCCGWYHPAERSDQVVILCGTLGFEALITYRALRILADMLAAAGIGVLRFDYPGTGDSPGDEGEPGRFEDWRHSVVQAVGWVREQIAPNELILLGLHFGALLATDAASLCRVDKLVLLAPVVSGRSYIRECEALARLAAGAHDAAAHRGADWLHATTRTSIAATNLALLQATPATDILLLEPAGIVHRPFLERLASLGCRVTQQGFIGYDALLRDAHLNETPITAFASIVAWLASPARSLRPARQPAASSQVACAGVLETRVQFASDAGDRLVGVLCRPELGQPRLGLIIGNTGAIPRFGHARFAVVLSRALARHGVATLRMDMAGVGDSVMAGADCRPPVYRDRTAEMRAAVDLMQAYDVAPLAACGVCSGAFHAFTAARSDERIRLLVLINQEVFDWQRRDASRRVRTWLDERTPSFLRRQAGSSARASPLSWRNRTSRALLGAEAVINQMTGRGFMSRTMKSFAARGTRALFILGEQEASALHLLQSYVGRGAARRLHVQPFDVAIVQGLDHSLSRSETHAKVLPVIQRYLLAEFGSFAPSASDPSQGQPPPRAS